MSHITDNQDALLDYLYEEGDPAERLAIATHLQECAACTVAVLEFQNVRGMLSDWTPPASPSLDAPVPAPSASVILPSATSPSASVNRGARGGWWRGWGPVTHQEKWGPTTTKKMPWFQAAAAILLFVSGMAASQFDFDYRDGVVRLGMRSAAPAANMRDASSQSPGQTATSRPVTTADIDEIVRRVRAQLTKENAPAVDGERLLQQVRAMIGQSEQRQFRELAIRLSQVAGEVDAQHRVDVERLQQDFGKQQEATMEYLVRTSGGAK